MSKKKWERIPLAAVRVGDYLKVIDGDTGDVQWRGVVATAGELGPKAGSGYLLALPGDKVWRRRK